MTTREEAVSQSADVAVRIWNSLTPEVQQRIIAEAEQEQAAA